MKSENSHLLDEALPGSDLIAAGLRDLEAGDETVAALLVAIGALRLSLWDLSSRSTCRTVLSTGFTNYWR